MELCADARWHLAALQAAFAEGGVSRQFQVSKEVAILGVSLFVLGLGLGPLIAGPMSEIYGRSAVYHLLSGFFFVFLFPLVFVPNICDCAVHLSWAWSDNAVHFDSGVLHLSISGWVLWGVVSQHSWWKC